MLQQAPDTIIFIFDLIQDSMSDTNSAKEAARRLYKRVSYSDGPLGQYELSSLLTQTYQILKIPFKPTPNDIKFYEQVLDADKDGKVTLRDLEARAVEYLCSNTLTSTISASSNSQSLYKKLETESIPRKAEISSYAQSSYSESSQGVSYGQYGQNSYGANGYGGKDVDTGSYNYNYKSSFQTKQPDPLSNYGHETVYSEDKNSNFSRSGFESIPERISEKNFDYGGSSFSNDQTSSYVNQSYTVQAQPQSYGTSSASGVSASQSQSQQNYQAEYGADQEPKPYSETVRQYLMYVGQVYVSYADPVDYTVTEADVPSLLRDTYAVLGREGYDPSPEDVRTWMKLCDVNNDGKVEFQQYEYFVVRSLERSGLNLYD